MLLARRINDSFCINLAKAQTGGMDLEDDLNPKLLAENAYKIFP